jgi:hypothetical protein
MLVERTAGLGIDGARDMEDTGVAAVRMAGDAIAAGLGANLVFRLSTSNFSSKYESLFNKIFSSFGCD